MNVSLCDFLFFRKIELFWLSQAGEFLAGQGVFDMSGSFWQTWEFLGGQNWEGFKFWDCKRMQVKSWYQGAKMKSVRKLKRKYYDS